MSSVFSHESAQRKKNSGFNSTLTYTTPSQLQSSQSAKRKR